MLRCMCGLLSLIEKVCGLDYNSFIRVGEPFASDFLNQMSWGIRPVE